MSQESMASSINAPASATTPVVMVSERDQLAAIDIANKNERIERMAPWSGMGVPILWAAYGISVWIGAIGLQEDSTYNAAVTILVIATLAFVILNAVLLFYFMTYFQHGKALLVKAREPKRVEQIKMVPQQQPQQPANALVSP